MNHNKLEQNNKKEMSAEGQTSKWFSLSENERFAIACLTLNQLPTEAGKDFTAKTGLTMRQWWRYYARVKDIYLEVAKEAPAQTLTILKVASTDAARELHRQLTDRKTENRNKAANDILEKVLPKEQQAQVAIQVNNQFGVRGADGQVVEL